MLAPERPDPVALREELEGAWTEQFLVARLDAVAAWLRAFQGRRVADR